MDVNEEKAIEKFISDANLEETKVPNQTNTCDHVQGILEGEAKPEDPIARYHIPQERKKKSRAGDDVLA